MKYKTVLSTLCWVLIVLAAVAAVIGLTGCDMFGVGRAAESIGSSMNNAQHEVDNTTDPKQLQQMLSAARAKVKVLEEACKNVEQAERKAWVLMLSKIAVVISGLLFAASVVALFFLSKYFPKLAWSAFLCSGTMLGLSLTVVLYYNTFIWILGACLVVGALAVILLIIRYILSLRNAVSGTATFGDKMEKMFNQAIHHLSKSETGEQDAVRLMDQLRAVKNYVVQEQNENGIRGIIQAERGKEIPPA